jgi:hypothetical protein
MKTRIEKDVQATIRLLRFLTQGEGQASISVFDAGAGGGFSTGYLSVYLERSGLTLKVQETSPAEFKESIMASLNPFSIKYTIEALNEFYEGKKWND